MQAPLDIAEDWRDLSHRLDRESWPRVLVLGAADAGKSTFCRYLAQTRGPDQGSFHQHAARQRKTLMGVMPQPVPPIYEPELAAEAIMRAAVSSERAIFVGGGGQGHFAQGAREPRLHGLADEALSLQEAEYRPAQERAAADSQKLIKVHDLPKTRSAEVRSSTI